MRDESWRTVELQVPEYRYYPRTTGSDQCMGDGIIINLVKASLLLNGRP
jgi:hypothetical protein